MKDESGRLNAASLVTSHQPLATNPSPLSPLPSPLFTVHTPTAVVTDLGTEFGVEVDRDGSSASYVFQGLIEMQILPALAEKNLAVDRRIVRLCASESARVACNESGARHLVVEKDCPAPGYVRRLGLDPSRAERFSETFDRESSESAFEQNPPGGYIIKDGAAEHVRQQRPDEEWHAGNWHPRHYIRSKITDFNLRDFVFEATVIIDLTEADERTYRHRIFFGLADGEPNPDFFDSVKTGLIMSAAFDTGQAFVEYYHPGVNYQLAKTDPEAECSYVSYVAPHYGLKPGRHRLRMWKNGEWVRFAVDADFDKEFKPDFISRPIHLRDSAPLLDESNSRLVVGAGNCDTMNARFEELSVSFSEPVKKTKQVPVEAEN